MLGGVGGEVSGRRALVVCGSEGRNVGVVDLWCWLDERHSALVVWLIIRVDIRGVTVSTVTSYMSVLIE